MKRLFIGMLAVLSALEMGITAQTAKAQVFQGNAPAIQPSQATPAQPAQTGAAVPGEQPAAGRDIFLARWIGIDNQSEIMLNQFASEKASSQEVKDFTQEMIRAHSDLGNKLNQAVMSMNAASTPNMGQTQYRAGYRGVQETGPATPGSAPATSPDRASRGMPGTAGATVDAAGNPLQPGSSAGGMQGQANGQSQPGSAGTMRGEWNAQGGAQSQSNPLNFKREINGKLAAMIEQRLGQKKGQEFDRCFIQGQIAGHVHMLATLEVARNQASSQLKPVLDDAINVAEKHLSHAESLLNKLEPQQEQR